MLLLLLLLLPKVFSFLFSKMLACIKAKDGDGGKAGEMKKNE